MGLNKKGSKNTLHEFTLSLQVSNATLYWDTNTASKKLKEVLVSQGEGHAEKKWST